MEDWSRRSFVIASFASVSTPVLPQSNVNADNTTEIEQEITKAQRHNLCLLYTSPSPRDS